MHGGIVINNDEIVLPPKHEGNSVRIQDIEEHEFEFSEDVLAFLEEMGITREELELGKFQSYDEGSRGIVEGQQSLEHGFMQSLTVCRRFARRRALRLQIP